MRVPRPKSGCDVKSLPLSPAEAFLLSRVDGTANERDLATLTGLAPSVVAVALDRLAQLGAIEGGVPAAPVSSPISVSPRVAVSVKPPRVEPPHGRSDPPTSARVAAEPAPRSGPVLYDPAELDEVVEIDDDKKRRILDLFYRLDDLTYYEVLGVDPQADKKRIKSAYYAMAPEFHPDRFFRKSLGAFKTKIEAIFNRVTIAHDVITAKERRAEYDAYLAQTQKNRVMAAIIEQTPRDVAREPAVVEVPIAAPAPSLAPPSRPASDRPAASVRPSVEPGPISAEAARIRRETLARKLSGTMRRPTPPPPVAPDPAAPQRTADALRLRHDLAVADARRAQLQRLLDEGKAALVDQQFAAAASAYRIAASLAPDDAEVQTRFSEAMRLADASLADGYLKQAQYEESQGRWGEAALSYSKVCNGLPGNAAAHDRVAFTTLKSSANIRRAVEFARRAVELEPKTPQFRLTLASAYQAAGLEKSALGEIERALELAPGDPKIKDLAQQVRVQAQKPAN